MVQKGGLDQLGEDERPFDDRQRNPGMYHPSFRDRRDGQRFEVAVGRQPVEIVL